MEIVLAESIESEKERYSSQSASTKLESPEKEEVREKENSLAERQTSTTPGAAPIRLITAEYMQAQEQLNSDLERLHNERGFQERVATSITDQMQIETQELISLFGIPYVVSPTEAESQCAFLDRACLTEGSITDDSDIWVFGGQRVYKNFFSQGQKHVELYQAADIQRVLNLNREKLIGLAMMIGSDYSDGIQGVGPVLALEILSEFSSVELEGMDVLVKFRDWWEQVQTKPADVFAGSKLKEKLRKLQLRPGFPNPAVYDAFSNPSIDTSTESFKWGNPDLDAIRTYTNRKFGWDQSKCDSQLLPVLKNRQCEAEQSRQLTLDSYISFGKIPTLESGKRKKTSKRMESAVKKLKLAQNPSHELNLSSESDDEQASQTASQKRLQVTNRAGVEKAGKRTSKSKTNARGKKKKPEAAIVEASQAAATSGSSSSSSATNSVSLPTPSKLQQSITVRKPEVIPQRVQAESDKLKNKQRAIQLFQQKRTRTNK